MVKWYINGELEDSEARDSGPVEVLSWNLLGRAE